MQNTMRNNVIIGLLVLFSWIFAVQKLHAGGSESTAGATFLELGVGTRALGMGEAFTAEPNDLGTLYFNPAGLASLKYPVLSLFHHELIEDSRLENITMAYPIKNGFLGVANTVFWVPAFEKIDINGLNVGTVQFYNGCLTVGYGYNFKYFYMGASAKYVYQRIDNELLHAFAMDFGIMKGMKMWSPFESPIHNFHVGLSFLNIGTDVKGSPLPRTMRLGFSYKPLHWLGINLDLRENIIKASDLYDFTYGFDKSFRMSLGMELNYLEILYIRGGWRFNDSGTYTVGLGVNFAIKNVGFVIDASFADSGRFTPTYSFTVAFKLIPRVITLQDKIDAEKHYREGIKRYINNELEPAIDEFKEARKKDPYHKNVDKKIRDLEEIKKLKNINDKDSDSE